MLDAINEELNFALWYLKQRGLAVSDDKSNLQITVEGWTFFKQNRPSPESVMALIRQAGLKAPQIEPKKPPSAPVNEGGAWRDLLSRHPATSSK